MFAAAAGILYFSDSADAKGLAQNAVVGVAFVALDSFLRNTHAFSLFLSSAVRHRNDVIRVSIAYLYRIKVDSKYLLIRSERTGLFQPVGGVFKRYEGAKPTLAALGVQDDRKLPIDESSLDDLRIHVAGRHLLPLLRWFDSGADRETSAHREFHEELILSGIVDPDVFRYPVYRLIGRKRTGVQFSPYFKCWELRIADTVELVPTPEQMAHLRTLSTSHSSDIMFATADEIESLGVVAPQQLKATIGEHTRWIL